MKLRTKKRLVRNAAKRKPNPLRLDPTRTSTLRRIMAAELRRRFKRLRLALHDLIVKDDAFGLAERKPFNPLANFDPDQPRDESGRWSSMGGGGAAGQYVRESKLPNAAVEALKAVGAQAAHIEHIAKSYVTDKIGEAVAKLPEGVQDAVEAAWWTGKAGSSALFAAYTLGQHMAERVAKERGLSDEQAKQLRGVLSKTDLGTFEVFKIAGLAGVHAAHLPALVTGMIPVASAGYLAYSTARNPMATLRAAGGLVNDALDKAAGFFYTGPKRPTGNAEADIANLLADALADHGWDDWWVALYSAALDRLGDGRKALELADRLHERHQTANVFCPTGEGGGIDPSCSSQFASNAIAKAFGHRAKIKYVIDDSGKAYGEHGKDATVVNPHLATGKPVSLNFRAAPGVTEADHLGSHELVHQVYSNAPELGLEIANRLLQIKGPYGSAVSIYGAFEGKFENVIELGASYSHSPTELKAYSPEMYALAKEWSDRYKKTAPTANAGRYAFLSNPEKVAAFRAWLASNVRKTLIGKAEDALWQRYAEAGLKKGAGRAFDDATRSEKVLAEGRKKLDFYAGSRDQFLRSSFNQPVAIEKIKLLAGRTYDDLANVTEDMSTRMSRTLTDGLVEGKSPHEVARDLDDDLELGRARTETIARTELIRAHAEGQLDALEKLSVEEVGVMVEWSVTDGPKYSELTPKERRTTTHVCRKCEPLDGVVVKLAEARNMIPRHPNCRCAWVPANVGEDDEGQKDDKRSIEAAIAESLDEGEEWGPGAGISKDRPESILNVFCPTGEGGGIDPSCSPSGVGSSVPPPPELGSDAAIQESYISDSKMVSESEVVANRAERVKRTLEKNDARLAKVQEKVAKMWDKKERLSKAHDREVKKLDSMFQAELGGSKMSPELIAQAERTDEALSKFFSHKKDMDETAWKEIRKYAGSEDNRFETGFSVMKKIELLEGHPRFASLNDDQKKAVALVEQRLGGAISSSLSQRITETRVTSIAEGQEQRAYFKGTRHGEGEQVIYLPRKTDAGTVAHELGHSLETNANVHAAAQGFLYMRVGKEPAQAMGEGYKFWEVGRKDRFDDAFGSSARYVGKHYKTDDTEVVSMGLEKLYSDPVHFAKTDPQYFKFMLGLLGGSFS